MPADTRTLAFSFDVIGVTCTKCNTKSHYLDFDEFMPKHADHVDDLVYTAREAVCRCGPLPLEEPPSLKCSRCGGKTSAGPPFEIKMQASQYR